MKKNMKLMNGNEAIARGAYEAGVKVSSAYPGTPSTEISENIVRYKDVIYSEWSTNEKTALEVGIGASISGVRAIVSMKSVGFNVALDPLMSVSYTGVGRGLVIIVGDDPGMHSSQNEQDTRLIARAAEIPILEPSDSQEAKDFTKLALKMSEEFDTPVLIRITTRIAHSYSIIQLDSRIEVADIPYKKNRNKTVLLPEVAKKRHFYMEQRIKKLELWNSEHINSIEMYSKSIGIITSGISYQYVKEAIPDASILKLNMVYPLPRKVIEEFVTKINTLYVVEELEPFMEEQISAWGIEVIGKDRFTKQGEYTIRMIKEGILEEKIYEPPNTENINRSPTLCVGCSHQSVFSVLKEMKLHVTGDIGCYTLGALPPINQIDTTFCMGASISTLHGIEKAKGRDFIENWVSIIGDSTFLHSGINSLMNMVYNCSSGTVLILDNSTTAMTGHQDHAGTGKTLEGKRTRRIDIWQLCKGIGVDNVYEINAYNKRELKEVIAKELVKEELSVIIIKSVCLLLKKSNPSFDKVVK